MSECMDWPLKIGGRCGEVAVSGSSKVLLISSNRNLLDIRVNLKSRNDSIYLVFRLCWLKFDLAFFTINIESYF